MNPQQPDIRKSVRLTPFGKAADWKTQFSVANWLRSDLQRLAATIDEILDTPVLQ
jgi:hypothetical protein